jgi:hypothetical protein
MMLLARWEEIRQSTSSKWASVKGSSVADSINTIKDKISEGIEKIKEWNATKVKEKVFSIVERIKRVFSGQAVAGGATYTQHRQTLVELASFKVDLLW